MSGIAFIRPKAGTPLVPPQLGESHLRYDRGPAAAHDGAPA